MHRCPLGPVKDVICFDIRFWHIVAVTSWFVQVAIICILFDISKNESPIKRSFEVRNYACENRTMNSWIWKLPMQ